MGSVVYQFQVPCPNPRYSSSWTNLEEEEELYRWVHAGAPRAARLIQGLQPMSCSGGLEHDDEAGHMMMSLLINADQDVPNMSTYTLTQWWRRSCASGAELSYQHNSFELLEPIWELAHWDTVGPLQIWWNVLDLLNPVGSHGSRLLKETHLFVITFCRRRLIPQDVLGVFNHAAQWQQAHLQRWWAS